MSIEGHPSAVGLRRSVGRIRLNVFACGVNPNNGQLVGSGRERYILVQQVLILLKQLFAVDPELDALGRLYGSPVAVEHVNCGWATGSVGRGHSCTTLWHLCRSMGLWRWC